MTLIEINVDGKNVKDMIITPDDKEGIEKYIIDNTEKVMRGIRIDHDGYSDDEDDEPSVNITIGVHCISHMEDDEGYWHDRMCVTATKNEGERIVTDKKLLVTARLIKGRWHDTLRLVPITDDAERNVKMSWYLMDRYISTFFPDLKQNKDGRP